MSAHTPLVQQQKLWKAFFIFLMPLIATNILQNLSGTPRESVGRRGATPKVRWTKLSFSLLSAGIPKQQKRALLLQLAQVRQTRALFRQKLQGTHRTDHSGFSI